MTDPIVRSAILIRKPVAEVFEAFVDPDKTRRFWFSHGSARLVSGQNLTWTWEMYGASTDVEVLEAGTLEDAITALASRADRFDVAILSPGAPSYGQLERPGKPFSNFEERGKAFVRLAAAAFGDTP